MYCLLTVLILLISGGEVDSTLTLVVTPTRPMEMLTPLNVTCLYTPSSSSVSPATVLVLMKSGQILVRLTSSQSTIKIEKDDVTFEGQLSPENAYNASYIQVVWKLSSIDLSSNYGCVVEGGETDSTTKKISVQIPTLSDSVRYFVTQNLEMKTALLGKTNEINQLKLQLNSKADQLETYYKEQVNKLKQCSDNVADLKTSLLNKAKDVDDFKLQINPKVDEINSKIEKYYKEQDNKLNQCSDNLADLKTSLLNKAKDVDDFKLQINPKVDEINSKIETYYRELKSTDTQFSSNIADINNSLMSKANEINALKDGNWRFESGSFNCGDLYNGFPSYNDQQWFFFDYFTVSFQTPFKAPPIVMYSVTVLKTDLKSYYGHVTYYYDLNTNGFGFGCGKWVSSTIYQIGVFWVAIGR